MNELKAWSYSKYSCYKLCPFQFKCKYIDKIPQGKAPALERGIRIHEEAENFLDGTFADVPESCESLEEEFKIIKKKKYEPEMALAFDEDWNVVDWFDDDAFLRMKIDASGFPDKKTIKLIDFKTGKVRDNYQEQVELYTTAAFTVYDVEESLTELWYLDHGFITDEVVYHVDDYEKLLKKWARRITPMFDDTKFLPKPNYLCKNYCDFAKHKGGQCKHGK